MVVVVIGRNMVGLKLGVYRSERGLLEEEEEEVWWKKKER